MGSINDLLAFLQILAPFEHVEGKQGHFFRSLSEGAVRYRSRGIQSGQQIGNLTNHCDIIKNRKLKGHQN